MGEILLFSFDAKLVLFLLLSEFPALDNLDILLGANHSRRLIDFLFLWKQHVEILAAHQMNGQSSKLKTIDIAVQVANNQGVVLTVNKKG